MNQFYVSIIFIGITLIIITAIWIAYDRKKSYDYLSLMDAKKEELLNIINDAEQMVQELNKFSDYIVTQLDVKNNELCSNLKKIEEKSGQLTPSDKENKVRSVPEGVEKTGSFIDVGIGAEISVSEHNLKSGLINESTQTDQNDPDDENQETISAEKIMPLNGKFGEIVQLSKSGMTDVEIAKKMNIGKGEVKLILEINK